MKKGFVFLAFWMMLITINGFAQGKAFPNPSVAYIEKMGYIYQIQKDEAGNERGVCVFPDGTKADAWDFLQGKAGDNFSYCTRNGYSTETRQIDHGSFTEVVAVCSRKEKNGQKTEKTMLDLMEKNGEPLIGNIQEPSNANPPEERSDPNLKSATILPASFDWRNFEGHSFIGPVRNQGSCGSCYSFGANANAEGVYNVAMGKYDGNCIDLSESFIIWCMGRVAPYSSHFYGCNGADYTYYELKSLVDSGTTYEANFPYQQTAPTNCTHWNDPRIRFTNYYRVGCSDIAAIKNAIMTYGVVDAAVYVSTAFQNYKSGVFIDNSTACSTSPCYYTPTNHAIALVGWGVDAVKGEYWILRNSWGASWGESGYMRIATTSARVACEVAYVTYIPQNAAPAATTVAATNMTNVGATLNGTVNANGLATTVTFEYGLTASYGSAINATPNTLTGNTLTAVSAALTGLTKNTTYHFRVKAVNSGGTTYGSDLTFTTFQQACIDQYETNNTLATAKQITSNTAITALINTSTDQDWFKFSNTSSAKYIKVELFNLPADYDLGLYNSQGVLLGSSVNRGTTPELIIYNTTKVGTYYVKVFGYNGAYNLNTCYSLRASTGSTLWKLSGIQTDGENENENTLLVYPNPSNGIVNLDYHSVTNGNVKVIVSSITGLKISTLNYTVSQGMNTFALDLANQPAGMYIIDLTGENVHILKKLMLQK